MAYEIVLLTTMSIAILFALSLNVITGFCGQVSLGHAAFFGIGAYTAALLTKAGVRELREVLEDAARVREVARTRDGHPSMYRRCRRSLCQPRQYPRRPQQMAS